MPRINSSWIKKHISIEVICLVLILCIAVFFRFYNTPNRYGFDGDPTRDALVIFEAAKEHVFPIIGVSSGIAPITFGPWYYYQLILFQIIFPFAFSPWAYIGITSVLVSFILYKTGELLGGKRFGLLLAFLAAISPAETGQTQGLSNPNLIPFYAALVLWLFIKLLKAKSCSVWLFFLWGFLLSVGMNVHYQMVGLCFLPLVYFIYRREQLFPRFGLFLLGFFIPWIPLLIFNMLYHWNTVAGLSFFFIHHHTNYIPNSWKIYLGTFWLPFWSYVLGVNNILGLFTILFTIVAFVYVFIRKQLSQEYLLLVIAFLFNLIFFRYALAQRDYYYYLFLHGFIFIFFAFALWQLHRFAFGWVVAVVIMAPITIGMIQGDISRLATRQDQIMMRTQATELMQKFSNQDFALFICSEKQRTNAQGTDFFLNIHNRLSDAAKSTQLGFIDTDCSAKALQHKRIKGATNLVNITGISNKQLTQEGWTKISPKTEYYHAFWWWTTMQ